MAVNIFSVSINDEELLDWVKKMKEIGQAPSFSLVLRDGLLVKKKQWELQNGENNPEQLRQRLEESKKVVGKFSEFIEQHKLTEQWFEYSEQKENRARQKEILERKGIETIEIQGTKKKTKTKLKGGKN